MQILKQWHSTRQSLLSYHFCFTELRLFSQLTFENTLKNYLLAPIILFESVLDDIVKESRVQLGSTLDYLQQLLRKDVKTCGNGNNEQINANESRIEESFSLKEVRKGDISALSNRDPNEKPRQTYLNILASSKNYSNEQREEKEPKISYPLRKVKNPIQSHYFKKRMVHRTETEIVVTSNHITLQPPMSLNWAKKQSQKKYLSTYFLKNSFSDLQQSKKEDDFSQKLASEICITYEDKL